MKKVILVIMMILVICGCGKIQDDKTINNDGGYKTDMKADSIILDVREKYEYDELHVKGAINIPLGEINETIDLDKNKTIYVYCKSGVRSTEALKKLESYGYTVINLGGIDDIDMEKIATKDLKVKKIVDKTNDIKDFTCAEALENFYSDDKYNYYFSCIKSSYIVVVYEDDSEEEVSIALKNGTITIKDLDKYNIAYYKYDK